jgi:prepilin-type N-terminal cleavage/methylation domain-containing protein
MRQRINHQGFTLAELLIALAILGVIATFTIPKILMSQQSGQDNARIKDALAMVSQAYSILKNNNSLSSSTTMGDLTPYMNYVNVDTATSVDMPWGGVYTCNSGGYVCLRLHTGTILEYQSAVSFGGTNTTNALWFVVDADGKYNGNTGRTTPGVGFCGFLYYNGRLTSHGNIDANTVSSDQTRNPNPTLDPSWFSW